MVSAGRSRGTGWGTSTPKPMPWTNAESAAREIERDGGLAQVVVHEASGEFGYEHTYGEDPSPPSG